MTIYFIAILSYLTLLVVLSALKSRKVKDQADFVVAGRGATAWLLVATLVATWIGSGSLFGGAGASFRNGFSYLWSAVGAWAAIVVVFFLAHRVRRMAELSVPDILERRYSAASRILGSLIVIIAYVAIAGYQFRGMGRLLQLATSSETSAGLEPFYGGLIACAFIVTFTMLAGMTSIVSFDFFNGILMLLGVGLAIPFALNNAGGMEGVQAALPASHFDAVGEKTPIAWLGLALPVFFLLLGDSGIYQKFFSARDEKTARRAVLGMIVGVVVVETAIVALAVFGSAFFYAEDDSFRAASIEVEVDGQKQKLDVANGLDHLTSAQRDALVSANPDLIVYQGEERKPVGVLDKAATETVILSVARHKLPLFLGCLLFVAAVAIVFSTANTFLMVASTNLTRDIYQRFLKPKASESHSIWVQRILIAAVGFGGCVVAFQGWPTRSWRWHTSPTTWSVRA